MTLSPTALEAAAKALIAGLDQRVNDLSGISKTIPASSVASTAATAAAILTLNAIARSVEEALLAAAQNGGELPPPPRGK